MGSNNNIENESFQFMIHENEKAYQMIERHFDSAEKSTTLFLVIIGAILSVNGYVQKDVTNFSIFSLSDFQLLCALFISLIGCLVLLKVMEHRLLIMSYTKALNLNRSWFVKNLNNLELSKYLFWKATVKQPPYYRPYKHFFWELMGLATINAPFIAIFVINIIIRMDFHSKHYLILNWVFLIALSMISIVIMMLIYRKRANSEESKINQKIANGEIMGS